MIHVIQKINNKYVIYAIAFITMLILSTFAVNVVSSSSVYANTGCGVHSGTYHDYAGIIVNSRYKVDHKYRDGSTAQPTKWGQSDNTKVKVTTYGATTTPPGGIIDLGSNGQHFYEKTFNQTPTTCNVSQHFNDGNIEGGLNRTYMVLGTGGSSSDTDSGSTNWALDCDYSKRKDRPDLNNFQRFMVTGVGKPDNVPSNAVGGTWDVRGAGDHVFDPENGFTRYLTITYTATVYHDKEEKPKDPVGGSSISCTSFQRRMEPNSRYSFSYFALGYGEPPVNAGAPMTSPRPGGLEPSGRWNNYSGGIGYQSGQSNVSTGDAHELHSFNFPTPPDENWRGWRVIIEKWQKRPSDDKWHFDSMLLNQSCPVWMLTPSSWVGSPFVEQGRSVAFGHAITNSGNTNAVGVTRCTVVNGSCIDGHSNDLPVGVFNVPDNPLASHPTYSYTPLGSQVCQQYYVSQSSFLNSNSRTSDPACATVVGGKSYLGVTPASKYYIEPSEKGVLGATINTGSYTTAGNYPGYDIACNYNVISESPYGGSSTMVGNTNCGTRVDADGIKPIVNWEYTPNSGDVGKKICLNVTIAATNTNMLAPGYSFSGSSCFEVVHKPYMKVTGGDVAAASCTGNSSTIAGWNKLFDNGDASSAGNRGAGAEYAAYAQGVIKAFASGQHVKQGADYGYAPVNMSFANSGVNTSAGNFGGGFGNATCPSDYYDEEVVSTATQWASMDSALTGEGVKAFKATGDVTLSSVGTAHTINPMQNIRLYVDGDVIINGDINANYAGVADISQVPNIVIVAKKNIYINPAVSNLNGTFIAGENLYTCSNHKSPINSNNFTAPRSVAAMNSEFQRCNRKLTVTGSVVANRVHLLRTSGSLFMDNGNRATGLASAAEEFRYNPLTWILGATGITSDSDDSYDSINTLPPVL